MYLVPPTNNRRHIFSLLWILSGRHWGGAGIKNTASFWLCCDVQHTANLAFSLTLWFLPAEGTELCLINTLNPSQCISAPARSSSPPVQDSLVLAPFPLRGDIDLHFILFLLKTPAKLTIEVVTRFSPLKHNFSFISNEKCCFSMMVKWSGFRTLRIHMSNYFDELYIHVQSGEEYSPHNNLWFRDVGIRWDWREMA